jgi:hypothetical protein
MWQFYVAMLAIVWAVLVWLLTLPALIKHLSTERNFGDRILSFAQFIFTPLTLIVIAIIYLITRLFKLIWALIEAVMAVVLMLILIVAAPFVFIAERLNLKTGRLFELWMKIGDFVLDIIRKLFSKAFEQFAGMLVPSIKVKPPAQPPADTETGSN